MRSSIITIADPNPKPVIQYKKRDTRDQNFRNLDLLRKEMIPENIADENTVQKQRRDSTSAEVRHMSVTGSWGIFNQYIKNTAEPEVPLPSLKKQVDLTSNSTNILISKNKTYKNEKEVLIINKKRNMSMVRSILSNANTVNDHTGKKSLNFNSQNAGRASKAYCSDYYEFNIDKGWIEKYKKNQEEPWNNSSNFDVIIEGSSSNLYPSRKSAIDEYNQKRISTYSLTGVKEEFKFQNNDKNSQFNIDKNLINFKKISNKKLPDFTNFQSSNRKESSSKSVHNPLNTKFSNTSTELGSGKAFSELARINSENPLKNGDIASNSQFKEDYYNKLKRYSNIDNSISNFSNYQPVSSAEISKKDIFNHNFVKIRPDPQIMEKLKTGSNKGISNNIEIINENSEVSQLTIRKIPLVVPTKKVLNINNIKNNGPISSRASQENSGNNSFIKNNKNLNSNINDQSTGNEIKSDIMNNSKTKNKMFHMMDVLNRRPSKFKENEINENLSKELDSSFDSNSSKIHEKGLNNKISSTFKNKNNCRNKNIENKESGSQPNSTHPLNTKTCSQENIDILYSQNTITDSKTNKKEINNTMEEYLDKNFNLYMKEDLFKNNVIGKYVETIKVQSFYSQIPKHRKLFVIKDGSLILNHKVIQGKLIDVPNKRYFINLKTKKERLEVFYKFLDTCTNIFASSVKFKSIFLKDNSPIFDIFDIPDGDRYIYVSDTPIMRGIKIIYNKKKLDILRKYNRKELSKNDENYSPDSISLEKKNADNGPKQFNFIRKLKNKKRNAITQLKINKDFDGQFKKFKKRRKNNSIDINLRNLRAASNFTMPNESDQSKRKDLSPYKNNRIKNTHNYSFSEITENDEWYFYSDNEENYNSQYKYLENNYKFDKYQIFVYFNEIIINLKRKAIFKINQTKKQEIKEENENENMFNRIDKYNKELKKKEKQLQIYIHNKKKRYKQNNFTIQHMRPEETQKNKDETEEQTKIFMKKLLENMEIFKLENTQEIDHGMFYGDGKFKFVKKNKSLYENIYFHLDRDVDKYYPNLFYFNIPRLLKAYSNFDRKEMYEVFIQYKVLMKLCSGINKTLRLVGKGIDFKTFWKGVPQMSGEKGDLAYKLFNVINDRKGPYLSLEEFMKGMSIIRSSDISHKIDMFFKIIDNDGNGLLSFDEVYEISLMSLKRTVKNEDENSMEVVEELAQFFATLIFKLVDVDIDDEIPLPKVKEKIIGGGEEAEYLEMFCCADGFKKIDIIKF